MEIRKARNILLNIGWQNSLLCTLYQMALLNVGILNQMIYCHFKEIDSCSGTGMGFCKMCFMMEMELFIVRTMGGPPPRAYVDGWYRTKDRPKIDYGF